MGFLNFIYKIFCCQCTSCILWNEFGDTNNFPITDLIAFNKRKKELNTRYQKGIHVSPNI